MLIRKSEYPNSKIKGNKPLLGIIVPAFNEGDVLEESSGTLFNMLEQLVLKNRINENSFIAFIDDGSNDNTWKLIQSENRNLKKVKGMKLSRNFGHQAAILAGLEYYREQCDCMITIDADLQDDVGIMEEMLDKFSEGFDIVYGVRSERKSDSRFKRFSAQFFYKLMKLLGAEVIYNHADYRLTSRSVLQHLSSFGEVNLFLRGIFPLIGYRHTIVSYNRLQRKAGNSKYPLRKMISFAFDGISSFSIKPLRIVSMVGIIVFLFSLMLAGYSLYSYFSRGTVPGWTSITLPIYFISGIQILCIGIIGEYLGKVYKEIKHRPRYIIEKVIE
jgi:polyisoprenyl-phosphate glycosyltransferase